jgi:hypothetical protein
MNDEKLAMLLFDLWWLRYKKPRDQWYELTDYLRDCLVRDGYKIQYDDKNKDIKFDGRSVALWLSLGKNN